MAHSPGIWTRFSSRFHEASVGRMVVATTCGGLFPPRTKDGWISSGGFSSGRRPVRQQGCNLHEFIGEHGRCDPQLESLAAFGETALHAATAEQHRDAPLDACAKALAILELPGLRSE